MILDTANKAATPSVQPGYSFLTPVACTWDDDNSVVDNISYCVPVPCSVYRGVGQEEVDTGGYDSSHQGGGDKPPHNLPVQARSHT